MPLILTRRHGEKIQIGRDIVITVVGIVPTWVKLKVQAPDGVEVHRHEVQAQIDAGDRRGNSSLSCEQVTETCGARLRDLIESCVRMADRRTSRGSESHQLLESLVARLQEVLADLKRGVLT
jgi:carbon storage regulator CsrA